MHRQALVRRPSSGLQKRPSIPALLARLALPLVLAWPLAAAAQAAPGTPTDLTETSRLLERARQATLGVSAVAVDEARSARTLGRQRSGSGVLISDDGLVLTIGYLVLEADSVELQLDGARSVPARVVGYDVATGLGLVQALAPLALAPVRLGRTDSLRPDEPLMVASGGEDAAVSVATVLAQRPFSGYWEYHLDNALVTTPPRRDHSGAGLFNARGELVGIGSLLLADARERPGADGPRQPGNLFVPAELLPPILAELTRDGRSQASQRAWLGLNCAEQDGQVRVLRVTDDSPADVAGLEPGDRIVMIDGTPVAALATLWKTLWAGGPAERELTLQILRDDQPRTVKVNSVDRQKTLRRAQGI